MTLEQLKQIVPTKAVDTFYPHLVHFMPLYGITTKESIAAFIAQVAHESGGFKYVREIASGAAYEGRKDLGNVYPGDGKKFKGRGLIQVTGRTNYLTCSIHIFQDTRLLTNPELLATPMYAVQSACWFWQSRDLSEIANKPDGWVKVFKGRSYNKFQWITKRINGGQNGLADRVEFYNRAKTILQ